MSREFHYVSAGYMHSILGDVGDRPLTGEPVADAIRGVLLALAPLEHAVASEQTSDAGHDLVVLTCYSERNGIRSALHALQKAIDGNVEIVDAIIRAGLRKA